MNLLKKLWNWLVRKTSTAPKLAVVEVEPTIGELFVSVCSEHGVGLKIINQTNAIELYEKWYTGDADKESVLASIPAFFSAHSKVNAKMQRFFL